MTLIAAVGLLLLSIPCPASSFRPSLARSSALPAGQRTRTRLSASSGAASAPTVEADVTVVGGGPAGTVMAAVLSQRGLKVALADKNADKKWPNNYGVWLSEWGTLFAAATAATAATASGARSTR